MQRSLCDIAATADSETGISSPYAFETVSPVTFYRGPCINLLDIVRVIGAYLMRLIRMVGPLRRKISDCCES